MLNKKINPAYCMLFLFMLLLFGGNTYNADFIAYQNRYINGEVEIEDNMLFSCISLLFRYIGFPYHFFFFFEATVALVLVNKICKRYSDSSFIVLLLYFVYPFLLDIVQLDNCLGYLLVLYGLKYLEDEKSKFPYKYVLCVILAFFCHVACLVYLLFLLVRLKNIRHVMISVIVISLFMYSNVFLLPEIVSKIPVLSQFTGQLRYYTSFNSAFRNGSFLYALLLSALLFISFLKYREMKKTDALNKRDEFLFRLLFISISFIPLLIISSEFVRMIRNTWIIYYCFLTNRFHKRLDKYYSAAAIILAFFLFYKELSPSAYYFESVTKSIFENNIFF